MNNQKGKLVKCPSNVPHWHEASKDEAPGQIAVTDTKNGVKV
jgi:quercetin dioxygenase-like cupin family protein